MIEFIKKGNYRLDRGGIFVPEHTSDISTKFSDIEQDELFGTEDTSWWFQYRADVIAKIFMEYCDVESPVFDIGGGNGYTSSILKQSSRKIGVIEPSYGACLNAKRRNIEYVICDSIREDSPDSTLEQVMLLDVLEHIEAPDKFLKNIYCAMKSGGNMIITVPAFMSLWSSEDVYAGHFRRYQKKELITELEKAGFEVQYVNYFMGFLYIPIRIVRVWGEKLGMIKKSQFRTVTERKKIMEQQFKVRNGLVNKVLIFFEKCEMKRLFAEKNIRFGSSVIAVAVKRANSVRTV